MKLSLVVSQGNPVGKEIPVRQAQFLIGRDPECQLRPASPLVSKRHCAILIRDEKVFVRDFGSTNGTLINSKPLKGEIEVADGDELKCGPLAFRLKVEADVPLSSSDTVSDEAQASLADTGTMRVDGPKTEPLETRARPAAKGRNSEDDIADLLFNLEGDSSSGQAAIPQGTTVMSALDPEIEAATAAAKEASEKPKSNRGKIQDHKATSDAAKAILEKYMRRPRT
jgi:predicted component of type VI protein secretion system